MLLTKYLEIVAKMCSDEYLELHVHTDASYRDGAITTAEVFSETKRLGRKAVAITDHGNLSRLYQAFKERSKMEKSALETAFMNAGFDKKYVKKVLSCIGNIDTIRKPNEKMIPYIEKHGELFVEALNNSVQFIPGIEPYICPDKDYRGYYHFVLYAVDEIGLQALYKVANLGELNQYKGRGRITYADFERVLGEGTLAHGHVIGTSACVGGPIASTLLKTARIDKEIDKQNKKLQALPAVNVKGVEDFEKILAERNDELKKCKSLKSEAQKAEKKNFDTKLARVHKKIEDTKSRISLLEQKQDDKSLAKLTVEKATLEGAKKSLVDLEKEISECKELASHYDEYCKAVDELTIAIAQAKQQLSVLKKQAEPHQKILSKIAELNSEKEKFTDVYSEAKSLALYFEKVFGKGNFYIELYNHGIPDESYCLPYLKQIASETNIPLTVANDVHYAKPEHARKRNISVAIRRNKNLSVIENEIGNDQLYFKTNEEMQALFADVPEALKSPSVIANRCNVCVSHTWHLPYFDTKNVNETPNQYLRRIANENLKKKYPNFDTQSDEWKKMFNERFEYELNIIEEMGFSSYIAIVQDYIKYGRSIGGRASVGPGRGSAAGSLVCYLIDITDVDPLRYSLLFERFLNPARVSMPDIDVDFATFIREDVVSYVTELYAYKEEYELPELKHTVCNIMTEGVFAARSAVRNAGRVTDMPLDFCDKIAKMIPNKPKMTIVKAFEENPDFKEIYENDKLAKQLIDDARLIEGLPSHTGVHAAGIIIADKPITEYAPMFWNTKKNCWVIQYDMISCEADLKLLKMDFLGLTNLDVITDAVKSIKKNHNVDIDFDNINKADDPAVLSEIYAKGLTNGVFQFESGGMKKTLVEFAPKSIDDVALLNAAYRPGPMQYIPAVTDVKFGRSKKSYIVPEMAEILDETYGKPIYQEQIQKIFANIAGFDLGTADIIRRAMSKKHLDELVQYKDKFFEGLRNKGASETAIESFWTELLDFANYAFNKSHAVAYSLVSYQTAWLKHYYPCEFMAALLKYTPIAKIPFYIKEANNYGIKVLSPNINKSNRYFEPMDGNIQFGLSHIKGVSNNADSYIAERNARGEFKNFRDLITRMCIAGVNVRSLNFLILSGAFDSIIEQGNRKVYSEILKEYLDSCRTRYKKISGKEDVDAYQYLNENWLAPYIEMGPNFDKLTVLNYEKDLIGYYVSGHPLDDYRGLLASNNSTQIAEIDDTIIASRNNPIDISGQISDFLLLRRKSDGKAMCKFTFMDLTGEIECICFTKTFEQYNSLIQDGAIVKLIGYPEIETEETDGEVNIISKQFVVTGVLALSKPKKVFCFVNNIDDYVDVLQPAITELGIGNDSIILVVKAINRCYETEYVVSVTKEFVNKMKENDILCHFEKRN